MADRVLSSVNGREFGMRYAVLWLIAFAQFLIAPALAKTPFDGTWDVAVVTQAGSCDSSLHYRLTVHDGKVFKLRGCFGAGHRRRLRQGVARRILRQWAARGPIRIRQMERGIVRRPLQRPMEGHPAIGGPLEGPSAAGALEPRADQHQIGRAGRQQGD